MPMPKKKCPDCGTLNEIGKRTCEKEGCGHKFKFKVRKRKRKDAEESTSDHRDADDIAFVAGWTDDGRFLISWPSRFDHIILSKTQAALVYTALDSRAQDVPQAGGAVDEGVAKR